MLLQRQGELHRRLDKGTPVMTSNVSSMSTLDFARMYAPTTPARGITSRVQFFLFILITATLFIRPTEIVDGLDGLHIYELLNVAAIVLALPLLLKEVHPTRIFRAPITVCVIGLW